MNTEVLAKQAGQLSPDARSQLGLLVVWLLSPMLRLDRTAHGQERQGECLQLLDEAFAHVGDPDAMRRIEGVVATGEELRLSEEPEDPSIYRLDFVTALLYALGASTDESSRAITACLMRAGDAIDLAKTEGVISTEWNVENILLQTISKIQELPSRSAALTPTLQKILKPAYDSLASAVGEADS
jgi:hypothetical protein